MVDSCVVTLSVPGDAVDPVVGSGEIVCSVAKKRRRESYYTVYVR